MKLGMLLSRSSGGDVAEARERAEHAEKIRMTASEILELAEPDATEPAYDLRTADDCFAYAKFLDKALGQRARPIRANRFRAKQDAEFIESFSGEPVKIFVFDNRKAIVPAAYADFCDSNAAPALRVFGYGGRA